MRTFAVDTAGTATVSDTATDAALLLDRTRPQMERVFWVDSNGTSTSRVTYFSRFLNRFLP